MSQIACKLSSEPNARVTNMRSEVFFIFSYGAHAIFLPSEAENTTFVIGLRERKWYTRAEGEGGKHEMSAGQFYSRGGYNTIFPHT